MTASWNLHWVEETWAPITTRDANHKSTLCLSCLYSVNMEHVQGILSVSQDEIVQRKSCCLCHDHRDQCFGHVRQ